MGKNKEKEAVPRKGLSNLLRMATEVFYCGDIESKEALEATIKALYAANCNVKAGLKVGGHSLEASGSRIRTAEGGGKILYLHKNKAQHPQA